MKNTTLPHEHEVQNNLESIESALIQIDRFETIADIFKKLSDTSRIRIFWLLCHTEQCVINISAMMDMSSPAVPINRHLPNESREIGCPELRHFRMNHVQLILREADFFHNLPRCHKITAPVPSTSPNVSAKLKEQER